MLPIMFIQTINLTTSKILQNHKSSMQSSLAFLALLSISHSANAAAIHSRSWTETNMALQDTQTGFCLSNYAADGQLYSKTYSDDKSEATVPDKFSLIAGPWFQYTLEDVTIGKECVHTESGQTSFQFQCSGDSDGSDSTAFSLWGDTLAYKSGTGLSNTFFGCGTSGSASSTGVNYFAVETNPESGPGVCYQTTLKFVDASACKTPVPIPSPCGCPSGWTWSPTGCCPSDCENVVGMCFSSGMYQQPASCSVAE